MTLIRTEKSKPLLDGLSWHFCTDTHFYLTQINCNQKTNWEKPCAQQCSSSVCSRYRANHSGSKLIHCYRFFFYVTDNKIQSQSYPGVFWNIDFFWVLLHELELLWFLYLPSSGQHFYSSNAFVYNAIPSTLIITVSVLVVAPVFLAVARFRANKGLLAC